MIYIATPSYGGQVDVNYHLSTIALVHQGTKMGMEFKFPSVSHESLVTRARNFLLHDFMCSPCDTIAWIDSDIGYDPRDLLRLVNAAKELKFVCGAYPKKGLDLDEFRKWAVENPDGLIEEFHDYAFNPLEEGGKALRRPDGGLYLPVRHSATGFMVWTREAAQKLIDASVDHAYWSVVRGGQTQATFRVFHTDDVKHEYLSEDYWVCDLWRSLGEKMYVDLNCRLTHSGRYTWHGCLGTQFSTTEQKTDEVRGST